jgi:hypothetical protein
MGACLVCRRDTMGPFPAVPAWLGDSRDSAHAVCSIVCLSIFADRKNPVMDKTEHETLALEKASDQAGEYLEELGEADLRKLSREQWMTLLEVVVTAWTDTLREMENGSGRHSP